MSGKQIVIIIILLLEGVAICHADLHKDLEKVNKEITKKRALVVNAKKAESKASGDLDRIEKNLKSKMESLSSLNRDLSGVEVKLGGTYKEIEVVKAEADRKKVQIRQRLVSLYKAGEFSAVRMFFSSESFPQSMENFRYMNSVLQNDRKLFEEYNGKIERLKGLKASLEKDMSTKQKIKADIQVKKQEIEEEKNQKSAYLKRIREEKKGYQASLRELQANSKRLQSMVERLEARSRKSYSKKSVHRPNVTREQSLPPVPDKGFASQKGRLSIPIRGQIIARFGRHKHPEFNSYTVSNGISIAAAAGTEIHPVYDGQVIFADYFKGYGNLVIVDHGGGFFTLYGHASKIVKKAGSMVSRSDVIANVGDVDSSQGPLLYFEIRYQGKPVDPMPWFRKT